MNELFGSAETGPLRRVEVASGSALSLPLGARRTLMAAMFRAPTREVQKLVPSRRLRPVELAPRRTLVGLVASEVEAEGLPPYAELSVLVPVRYAPRFDVPLLPILAPGRFDDAGYFVHRLVSTSPVAAQLAEDLQGARATVCDMQFDEQPFWRKCTVSVQGQRLLTLEVKKTPGRPMHVPLHQYSQRGSDVLRTPCPLHGLLGLARGAEGGRLTLHEHYVADELRALRLSPAPLFTLFGAAVESVVAAPDRVLPA